jgi:hypothetical protein
MKHSRIKTWTRYAVFLLCSALVGCTIAPKPIKTNSVSFVGGYQDAGIIDFRGGKVLVRADYVSNYEWLAARYGAKLSPPITAPVGVTADGAYYLVTKEGAADYARLVQIYKNTP